jgi:hypothetical protein
MRAHTGDTFVFLGKECVGDSDNLGDNCRHHWHQYFSYWLDSH